MRKKQNVQDKIDSLRLEISKKYEEIYKLQDIENKLFIDIDKIREKISEVKQQAGE